MSLSSMKNMTKLSLGEEVGNTITHGVMALLFLFALPYAAILAYNKGGALQAFGVSVFVISIFLMLLISTIYHSTPFDSTNKLVFRILDHSCIYIAIAGSYTPIAISLIQGWQSILILVIEWSIVIGGILYKIFGKREFSKLSLAIYLIMGWIAVFFMPTIIQKATWQFILYIVLGGVFYSIGVYFYSHQRKKYYHVIWHIFINLASIMHFIAIVYYL